MRDRFEPAVTCGHIRNRPHIVAQVKYIDCATAVALRRTTSFPPPWGGGVV
jgi:hypothetical protein